jgi:hypothetical protein
VDWRALAVTDPGSAAAATIEACRLSASPEIYAIGTFDDRVTVLTQQKRALNLAWGLIETGRLPADTSQPRCRIAVLGGGFAGLTFATALLQKKAHCNITLFEERDTLLPLQQGSDTRWLHPHIYDWPAEGSEAVAAMLPVLNWTAARASDVVVQVLSAWGEVTATAECKPNLWCATRHIQLRDTAGPEARLEWVGEGRDPVTGGAPVSRARNARGRSENFDIVVLAVGFGLESLGSSYWRNEVLGQPGLEHRRTPYLVSGQGDGAMIDLLRLKISQFRQDRILAELFGDRAALVDELRTLQGRFLNETGFSLYEAFDGLAGRNMSMAGREMKQAIKVLTGRLRRDTEVILQFKQPVRGIADLLGSGSLKVSFQNALLVFMLYRCGGFTPASGELEDVAARFKVSDEHIVRRHGTKRLEQLKRLLPTPIYDEIVEARGSNPEAYRQGSKIQWSGGYFGMRGRAADYALLSDAEREVWRKEYLPGPTGLLAASIAGAVAGHLLARRPGLSHLRVTLHRVITIHGEDLLQQACDYFGTGAGDTRSTAGRIFRADIATIGQAYRTQRIVRSRPQVTPKDLGKAMERLKLNTASRTMSKDVRFLAALPVLQPESRFYAPSPVCAVLYLDSRDPSFDLDNAGFVELADIVTRAVGAARLACEGVLDRLENTALRAIVTTPMPGEPLSADVADQLVVVDVDPPSVTEAFVLNIDHSDVTPVSK